MSTITGLNFTREQAEEEIFLIQKIVTEGINLDPEIVKDLDFEKIYSPQIRNLFDWNHQVANKFVLPSSFRFKETGYLAKLAWNPNSKYNIVKDGSRFVLREGENVLREIVFERQPGFYRFKTKDGKRYQQIIQASQRGRVAITYSNECCLKDKGLDCKFCNINATKKNYGEVDGLDWKSPDEIGEAVAAAYKEGYYGFNLTGGFVPERREVDYYIDVVEAIIEKTGTTDVRGMACIGAPKDHSIIEQYKEAGFQHIATNLEVWDENNFKFICPGKVQECGGRENWLAVLKHEVDVFGKYNVRSNFVAGLEPKEVLLEGIEYLVEHGVLATATYWNPAVGSAFEGHQSPTPEWHHDLQKKIYEIYKHYGVPYEQFYFVGAREHAISYYYELDGHTLPWKEKEIIL